MLENPPRQAPRCVRDYPIDFLIELEELCDCDALYRKDAMVREGSRKLAPTFARLKNSPADLGAEVPDDAPGEFIGCINEIAAISSISSPSLVKVPPWG